MVVKTETLEQMGSRNARELHEAMVRQGAEIGLVVIQVPSDWRTRTTASNVIVAGTVPRSELAELFGHLVLKYLALNSEEPPVLTADDLDVTTDPPPFTRDGEF